MAKESTLSIITPTYKEAINIPHLVAELSGAMDEAMVRWEMVVVDDDSRDGIREKCAALKQKGAPIRLIQRKNQRGLATAVIEGVKHARGSIVVVMDADLSHRGKDAVKLYRAVEDGAEFAVGSRYISGGSTDDRWTVYRFLNSKIASLMAKPLVSISDPMSGFFAMHSSLLHRGGSLSPVGYKIGLEILIRCVPRTVVEIPIHFRTRVRGKSKLTLKQQLLYLRHIYSLYHHKWKRFRSG